MHEGENVNFRGVDAAHISLQIASYNAGDIPPLAVNTEAEAAVAAVAAIRKQYQDIPNPKAASLPPVSTAVNAATSGSVDGGDGVWRDGSRDGADSTDGVGGTGGMDSTDGVGGTDGTDGGRIGAEVDGRTRLGVESESDVVTEHQGSAGGSESEHGGGHWGGAEARSEGSADSAAVVAADPSAAAAALEVDPDMVEVALDAAEDTDGDNDPDMVEVELGAAEESDGDTTSLLTPEGNKS
jgi:hypothetical protein